MSSKITLEINEDLDDHVQLVRMEDIQPPPREKNMDNVKYEVETIEFDDNDSNGEIVYIDESDIKCEDSNEVVIEDCSEDETSANDSTTESIKINSKSQDGWPILEILPGGIIKNGESIASNSHLCDDVIFDNSELMYACAKCPEKFKNMFYLVKHVNWHNLEKKKQMVERKQVNLSVNKAKLKKQVTKKIMKKL